MTKKRNLGKEKVFLYPSTHEGSQDRSARQEDPGGKSWSRGHGGMLLTSLLPTAAQPLSYTTQNHQPWGGTTYSELGPPPSIVSQENEPQAYPQANLLRTFDPTEVPSSKMTLTGVKLT